MIAPSGRRSHLVIAGAGPGVVITDTTCQGKALFVVTGDDTTIRDLTLARARVPDRNGAGIREEGQGLILRRVQFVDNQVGLLDGSEGAGEIIISDCGFEGGGIGGERPTFAVLVNAVSLLRIEGSTFKHVNGGQISTSAARDGTFRQSDRGGNGRGARGGNFERERSFGDGGQQPLHWAALAASERRGAGHGTRGFPELRRNRLLNGTAGRQHYCSLDRSLSRCWRAIWSSQATRSYPPPGYGGIARPTCTTARRMGFALFAGQVKRDLLDLLGR